MLTPIRQTNRSLHIAIACFAILVLLLVYFVISANAAEVQAIPAATPEKGYTLKEIFEAMAATVGIVTFVVGVAYGLYNRKKYDNLRENIEELESLLKTADRTNESQKKAFDLKEAEYKLKEAETGVTVINLKTSNTAVVKQNLQCKAILRMLRIAGKWEGHEDEIFTTDDKQ